MTSERADALSQPEGDRSLQNLNQEASEATDHLDKDANPEEEALVDTLEEGDPKKNSLEEAGELATDLDSEAESDTTGNSSGEEFNPEGSAARLLQHTGDQGNRVLSEVYRP